jgi:hypothetical protein
MIVNRPGDYVYRQEHDDDTRRVIGPVQTVVQPAGRGW